MHLIDGRLILVLLIIVFLTGAYAAGTSNECELSPTTAIIEWDFKTGLDGWERFGSVPPWHSMENGIKWHDKLYKLGDTQGVIVIDACNFLGMSYSGGIRKTITLLNVMPLKLSFELVKVWGHDGGVKLSIIDANGEHILEERILQNDEHISVSYDISNWAGKEVTISVRAFGAGMDMGGDCVTPKCCYEFIGVDSIRLEIPFDDTITLRELADILGLKIGSAAKSDCLMNDISYSTTLKREFSMLVPEWEMKFDVIWPNINKNVNSTRLSHQMTDPNYTYPDELVEFAKSNNMVVRGHTLIWHNPDALPSWIKDENIKLTRKELLEIMKKHIEMTISHYDKNYEGIVICWDVVNEAIKDNPGPNPGNNPRYGLRKDSIWYQVIGDDYIDKAFIYANQADLIDGKKDFKLFYNDYGGEWQSEKADAIYALVKDMKERNIPIDGVGFQMHIYDISKIPLPLDKDKRFSDNIKRFTDLGLEVHITEMDVFLEEPLTVDDLKTQCEIYNECMEVCLQNPKVTAFTLWGFTDKHTWKDPKNKELKNKIAPFLFNEIYCKKPSYYGLRSALIKRIITSQKAAVLDNYLKQKRSY